MHARLLFLLSGALVLGCWTGCVSETKPGRRPALVSYDNAGITELDVLAVPVALNFDQNPGPDGFVIKVYASSSKRPKPFSIPNGRLQVLMFEGVPSLEGGGLGEPRRTWNFTADQLRAFQIESSIGVGYQLAPLWGDAAPKGTRFTVLARYIPLKGPSILSAPSIISVGVR